MIAQVAAVGLNNIPELTCLDETRSRQTDISFDDKLKVEELRLSEKQKLLQSLPWTYLQGLFNATELEFDFEFSTAAIDNGLIKHDERTYNTTTARHQGIAQNESAPKSGKTDSPSASPAKLSYVIDQNSFLQNLMANSKYAVGGLPAFLSLPGAQNIDGKSIDLGLVIDELLDKIKMVKEGEKVSLSIALKPDQLGEMLLKVSMRNGLIFVSITATNETRDLIEANRATLEESLKKASINLGSLDVSSGGGREPFALWYLFESKAGSRA